MQPCRVISATKVNFVFAIGKITISFLDIALISKGCSQESQKK